MRPPWEFDSITALVTSLHSRPDWPSTCTANLPRRCLMQLFPCRCIPTCSLIHTHTSQSFAAPVAIHQRFWILGSAHCTGPEAFECTRGLPKSSACHPIDCNGSDIQWLHTLIHSQPNTRARVTVIACHQFLRQPSSTLTVTSC